MIASEQDIQLGLRIVDQAHVSWSHRLLAALAPTIDRASRRFRVQRLREQFHLHLSLPQASQFLRRHTLQIPFHRSADRFELLEHHFQLSADVGIGTPDVRQLDQEGIHLDDNLTLQRSDRFAKESSLVILRQPLEIQRPQLRAQVLHLAAQRPRPRVILLQRIVRAQFFPNRMPLVAQAHARMRSPIVRILILAAKSQAGLVRAEQLRAPDHPLFQIDRLQAVRFPRLG